MAHLTREKNIKCFKVVDRFAIAIFRLYNISCFTLVGQTFQTVFTSDLQIQKLYYVVRQKVE